MSSRFCSCTEYSSCLAVIVDMAENESRSSSEHGSSDDDDGSTSPTEWDSFFEDGSSSSSAEDSSQVEGSSSLTPHVPPEVGSSGVNRTDDEDVSHLHGFSIFYGSETIVNSESLFLFNIL